MQSRDGDQIAAALRAPAERAGPTSRRRRDTPDGGKELFGTIGVSENIIDASWQALVDAYEYHLLHVEEAATNR